MNASRLPLGSQRCARLGSRQRGVTMLFGLIALAIMLIGAAAMVRSMNTSLFNAGNLGFKRDLTNQVEHGMREAIARLDIGGTLGTRAVRAATAPSQNYSASMLPSNAQGLPVALVSDTNFATNWTAPDIDIPEQGVRVRYLIDRLCRIPGAEATADCSITNEPSRGGNGSEINLAGDLTPSPGGLPCVAPACPRVVYRVSVRVSGPRNTQSFFQTTLSPP